MSIGPGVELIKQALRESDAKVEALRKERDEERNKKVYWHDEYYKIEKERDAWKKLSDSQEVSLNSFRSERSQLLQERDAYREALETLKPIDGCIPEWWREIADDVLAKYKNK